MRRREFGARVLGIAGVLGAGTVRGDSQSATLVRRQQAQADRITQMLFPSSGGLLDAKKEPLTDESLIAVWAEPTAIINDRDGNGDAISYPDDVDIPLVGIDESSSGTVVGVGSPLVDDGNLVPELEGDDPLGDLGNEEFLLNIYDEYTDSKTILWDEGHGQFYDLASFKNFEAYVENNGYTVESTTSLGEDLQNASAIVITSPADSFTEDELTALSDFLDNGGLVVCHHQSDFNDFDQTAKLNEIATELGIGFRFNDAEVADRENNVGVSYLPLTGNFNDEFPLFEDRAGITISLKAGTEYDVTVDSVADGDTVDVVFDGEDIGLQTEYTGTVRLLGIDTPESASVAQSAERPEEWEGLAYDAGASDPMDKLVFDSTASLLDENGELLGDESIPVVYAEPSARNEDTDQNGDATFYPDDVEIPLAAVDGTVLGVGSPLVNDGFDTTADNEEFLLNVYDEIIDGETILWDEGHDQFYDLSKFADFESYAEKQGYDIRATSNLTADLSSAAAVVITSPSPFSDDELSALETFVQDGGAVLLHDQSDFDNFDETAHLNEIAAAVGAPFRFNDDQVLDDQNNAGEPFVPTTGNFDSDSPLFEKRMGIDDDPDARTTEYLLDRASKASEFASTLQGQDVTLFFDSNEPLRDPTRLLAYIRYDDSGDGTRETLYNRHAIEEGYARSYSSGLSRHDEFWQTEWNARQQSKGIWAESDLSKASPYRDRVPEKLFVPFASSIETTGSTPVEEYTILSAETTATQTDTNDPVDGQIPLCGRDSDNRTAVCGSLLISESYERLEGFPADTSGYDNFSLVTRVIESLTEEGDLVYVDGGHGQFGAEYALSVEDMAYYQRHLEGRQINLEQINDLTLDRLSAAHALVITTPVSALSSEELDAVKTFRDEGGAVVLFGSADAPADAISNLNQIGKTLGTDLRVNTDMVIDEQNNLIDTPEIPTTTQIGLNLGPPPLPGRESPPQDLDGDGTYEDLDGDGELSIVDVQLYFTEIYQQRDSAYVRNNLEYFDFNDSGSISIADVQLLFQASRNSNG